MNHFDLIKSMFDAEPALYRSYREINPLPEQVFKDEPTHFLVLSGCADADESGTVVGDASVIFSFTKEKRLWNVHCEKE